MADERDPDRAAQRRRGTAPALRATSVVEADGTEHTELAVYCPGCDAWQAIDGTGHEDALNGLATWGHRPQVPGDDAWGRTPISEIMTRRVVCVRPDVTVEQLATLFIDRQVGGAPVVGATGELAGVVTRGDLLRFGWESATSDDGLDDDPDGEGWTFDDDLDRLRRGFTSDSAVGDIMTPFAFSLPSHAPIAQAAALMAYEGVHRIVVTSTDGTIVGLVSGLDVLRWIARQAGYVVPEHRERYVPRIDLVGEAPADFARGTARRAALRGMTRGRPRVVMIVDDDASVREDYAELLREEGYQVLTAANGLDALEQLSGVQKQPSLILLDLKMPVMDGWSFHTRLSRDPNLGKIPVVLLSGATDVFEEASRLSADDFLLKPVPVKELLGTVEQYCS